MERPPNPTGTDLLFSPKRHVYASATMSASPSDDARHTVLAELHAIREQLAARIVDKVLAELPGYRPVDPAEILPVTQSLIDALLTALSEQRRPSGAELASYRDYGAIRARQGVPLVDVLGAWRMAVRMLIDEMDIIGRRQRVADRVLFDLVNDLLDTVDLAILEFTGGHREAELGIVRHDQQRRSDLARGLLLGLLGPAQVRAEAPRFGLDFDHEYIAFRACPTEATPADALERAIGVAHGHGLATTIDGDLAGFVDKPWDDTPDAAIGYGPPARLDQLQPAFAKAGRALSTAVAFGLTGSHDIARLGLRPAVLADPELGDELVHRYLTPIGTGDTATVLIDTVRAYLDSGLRVDAVAEQLYVHPNTVRYRIGRFEELTGTDLRKPQHAFEVWWALQRATLDSSR